MCSPEPRQGFGHQHRAEQQPGKTTAAYKKIDGPELFRGSGAHARIGLEEVQEIHVGRSPATDERQVG